MLQKNNNNNKNSKKMHPSAFDGICTCTVDAKSILVFWKKKFSRFYATFSISQKISYLKIT